MTSATVDSATTTFAYRGDGLRGSRTFNSNTTTFIPPYPATSPPGCPSLSTTRTPAMSTGRPRHQGDLERELLLPYRWPGLTMATVDMMVTWSTSIPTTSSADTLRSGSQANEFQFAGQQVDGSTGLQICGPGTTTWGRDGFVIGIRSLFSAGLKVEIGFGIRQLQSRLMSTDPEGLWDLWGMEAEPM